VQHSAAAVDSLEGSGLSTPSKDPDDVTRSHERENDLKFFIHTQSAEERIQNDTDTIDFLYAVNEPTFTDFYNQVGNSLCDDADNGGYVFNNVDSEGQAGLVHHYSAAMDDMQTLVDSFPAEDNDAIGDLSPEEFLEELYARLSGIRRENMRDENMRDRRHSQTDRREDEDSQGDIERNAVPPRS
jgi:hypothetical protein